jgi:hypothetical protein
MAAYVAQPNIPQETPVAGARITWTQVLMWLWQVIRFMVLVIFPFKNYDAKIGVLIGDDAKRSMRPEFLPSWGPDLESIFTSISSEKLEKGVLAAQEFDWQAHSLRWITFYQAVRDLLFALHRDLGFGLEVVSPHIRLDREGELGVGFVDHLHWDKRATLDEVVLETPSPNVVHLLATLISMLGVGDRVPYSHLNIETVDKGETSDVPPIRNEATIADVIAQRVLEFLTRVDRVVSLGPKSPGGGG